MNSDCVKRTARRGLALLGIAMLCSSCLYSRLLTFKDQLAEFDKNVALTNGGRTLEFQSPVIEAGDLTALTGFGPTHIEREGPGRETHTYRYRSLSPVAPTGTPQLLTFTLRFASNELFAFDYPQAVVEALGTNLVAGAAKAVGKSHLIQREHKLEWAMGTNQMCELIPSQAAIMKVLGPAQEAGGANPGTHATYLYLLEGTNGDTLASVALSASFDFDPDTTLLRHGVIHVGKLKLVVDFPPPP